MSWSSLCQGYVTGKKTGLFGTFGPFSPAPGGAKVPVGARWTRTSRVWRKGLCVEHEASGVDAWEDESAHRLSDDPSGAPDGGRAQNKRTLVELTRAQALALLGSIGFGRIVFTRDALPAIRPVNHILVDGQLVIRTHEGAALTAAAGKGGVVVAYEADAIDPDTRLGWSVVVTGFARLVTEPARLARYQALLEPWIAERMEYAVVIRLDRVDGFWLTGAGRAAENGADSSQPG